MALDTRDKRASALGVAVATLALVVPTPDGAVSQGDRQQTAFCYRGVTAAPPVTLPSAGVRRTWVLPDRETDWAVPTRVTRWDVPSRRTEWEVP